jgi:hypothetical protein
MLRVPSKFFVECRHAKCRDVTSMHLEPSFIFVTSLVIWTNNSITLWFYLYWLICLLEQWVETNPSNICIFPTDICFSRLLALHWRCLYGCFRMLDRLVSSHPTRVWVTNTLAYYSPILNTFKENPRNPYWKGRISTLDLLVLTSSD